MPQSKPLYQKWRYIFLTLVRVSSHPISPPLSFCLYIHPSALPRYNSCKLSRLGPLRTQHSCKLNILCCQSFNRLYTCISMPESRHSFEYRICPVPFTWESLNRGWDGNGCSSDSGCCFHPPVWNLLLRALQCYFLPSSALSSMDLLMALPQFCNLGIKLTIFFSTAIEGIEAFLDNPYITLVYYTLISSTLYLSRQL